MAIPDSIDDTDEYLRSGLIPIICQLIANEPGCNVVDLGMATTNNSAIFSANGARVFIDTSDHNLRGRVLEGTDLDSAEIDALLSHCPDAVDVVLFWDILDYMSLESLKKIMMPLSRIMRPGGLAYALASRQRYMCNAPAIIDVVREDLLHFHYSGPADTEAPQYAPKQFEQQMPGFVVEKLYLMQNGVQEHLFLFEGLD